MAALPAKPGPTRTAKTPKRVRFASEDREKTKIIRHQEAKKRDARSIPRVDVSYHFPKGLFVPIIIWQLSILAQSTSATNRVNN